MLVAWISEILVLAIEPTAHEFGLGSISGAEESMDLSLSIAIGSSVQVALSRAGGGFFFFVTPADAVIPRPVVRQPRSGRR